MLSIKSFIFSILATNYSKKNKKDQLLAIEYQNKWFDLMISKGLNTIFFENYEINKLVDYTEFIQKIPLAHYEDFIPYIDLIRKGTKNVLSQYDPLYLLKTSGTTQGEKHIPISKSGINHQINSIKKLMYSYVSQKKQYDIIDYKMLFLQGSPLLDNRYQIPLARLSGVVYHHIPQFFQRNKLPSYSSNIIVDWTEKIEAIKKECLLADISVFGGIPPWCVPFFELIIREHSLENLAQYFNNLKLYIHGGVQYDVYRQKIKQLLGSTVDTLDTYPASEGFFAFQDQIDSPEMLLLTNNGIFYEWIPKENCIESQPKTLRLKDVEINQIYEMVVTTDSGLWRYRMGDLVQFVSLYPFRIKVVGRTTQYISAFGEHVILDEIERTMAAAIDTFDMKITDYFVSPNMELNRYEWRIEWKGNPVNSEEISRYLDVKLASFNPYYKNLIEGKIISFCDLINMRAGTFEDYRIKSQKYGEQFKIVRISNTNDIGIILDSLQ